MLSEKNSFSDETIKAELVGGVLETGKQTQGIILVGATGFEPATTRTPSECATGLRYAPTLP